MEKTIVLDHEKQVAFIRNHPELDDELNPDFIDGWNSCIDGASIKSIRSAMNLAIENWMAGHEPKLKSEQFHRGWMAANHQAAKDGGTFAFMKKRFLIKIGD